MTKRISAKKWFGISTIALLAPLVLGVAFATGSNGSSAGTGTAGPPTVTTNTAYTQSYSFLGRPIPGGGNAGYQMQVGGTIYTSAVRFATTASPSVYPVPLVGISNPVSGFMTIPTSGTYSFVLNFALINYTVNGGGAEVDFNLFNASNNANLGSFTYGGNVGGAGNWRLGMPGTTASVAGINSGSFTLIGVALTQGQQVYVGAQLDTCCSPQSATVDLSSNGSVTVTRTGN